MSDLRSPETLLLKVARRLRVVEFARRLTLLILVGSMAASVVVVAVRLSGVAPVSSEPLVTSVGEALGLATGDESIWANRGILAGLVGLSVFFLAMIVALAWHRRPTATEAARRIDRHEETQDLFLTLTLLNTSAGDYQPLVARDAKVRSRDVEPAQVVPLPWNRGLLKPIVCLSIVAGLVLGVPQLDPFGQVAQAEKIEQQRRVLQLQARKTRTRGEQLAKDDNTQENSQEVKEAIDALKTELKKMKRTDKQANRAALNQQRKQIGKKYDKLNAQQLKQLLKRNDAEQKFGQLDSSQQQEWNRELGRGSTDGLKKEVQQLKQDLAKLSQLDPSDPESEKKREEQMRALQKKLRNIESFASKNLGEKQPLNSALQRARRQVQMMQSESRELSEQAAAHLSETMDLAEQELEQLAQTARDLQELDAALETARMAQKANEGGELDGEMVKNAQSLDDYRELYEQLMSQQGEEVAEGEGTGNKGRGKGGEPPEDDSIETGFKSEISKSALTAGKVLLTLKTKGQSTKGDTRQIFQENIRRVKQGVGEAIKKEEIPKGYIEGIKKYFNSLENPPEADAKKK